MEIIQSSFGKKKATSGTASEVSSNAVATAKQVCLWILIFETLYATCNVTVTHEEIVVRLDRNVVNVKKVNLNLKCNSSPNANL